MVLRDIDSEVRRLLKGDIEDTFALSMSTYDDILQARERMEIVSNSSVLLKAFPSYTETKYFINAPQGMVHLSIFSNGADQNRPCLYYIHGGGMIIGNRYTAVQIPLALACHFDAVVVSVEYRLAPEYKTEAQVSDCVEGLKWVYRQASDIGVDSTRIIVCGHSGGGGLAVGTISHICKHEDVSIQGQMLFSPMLDHTASSPSMNQYHDQSPWTKDTNIFAWKCVQGAIQGVQPELRSAAIGSAAYIDVGAAEIFRDETVSYASKLMQDNMQVELHVWAGALHGTEVYAPGARLSRMIMSTRVSWLATHWLCDAEGYHEIRKNVSLLC